MVANYVPRHAARKRRPLASSDREPEGLVKYRWVGAAAASRAYSCLKTALSML
jgi:hypothetical protein